MPVRAELLPLEPDVVEGDSTTYSRLDYNRIEQDRSDCHDKPPKKRVGMSRARMAETAIREREFHFRPYRSTVPGRSARE
jgi:hypothetical protein